MSESSAATYDIGDPFDLNNVLHHRHRLLGATVHGSVVTFTQPSGRKPWLEDFNFFREGVVEEIAVRSNDTVEIRIRTSGGELLPAVVDPGSSGSATVEIVEAPAICRVCPNPVQRICGGCNVRYCSEDCATADWTKRHRDECPALTLPVPCT